MQKEKITENNNNMDIEAIEILYEDKHCNQSEQDKVIIQTDSLVIQKVLTKEWEIPWSIEDKVNQICQLLSIKHVQFQHILREVNQLVDYFANLAREQGDFRYTSFKYLTSVGRKVLSSDKQ